MRAQIIMNMASKDKYKSLLERYKQTLIKDPKLNLSAYCRLNGVSVSGMHHYIEDVAPYGQRFHLLWQEPSERQAASLGHRRLCPLPETP